MNEEMAAVMAICLMFANRRENALMVAEQKLFPFMATMMYAFFETYLRHFSRRHCGVLR
jgi:5-methylcytosine-specific restriction endonuclease McrBC regulatory subunit McrC